MASIRHGSSVGFPSIVQQILREEPTALFSDAAIAHPRVPPGRCVRVLCFHKKDILFGWNVDQEIEA
jgi:hypothetical protein